MADVNTGAESATRAEPNDPGSCSSCGRPLTQLGPNGECLRCLFNWGATWEEGQSQRNAGVAPGPLRYGHFEVETDTHGFPIALGAGAMAVTYRARDTVLNSVVVLKVISLKRAPLRRFITRTSHGSLITGNRMANTFTRWSLSKAKRCKLGSNGPDLSHCRSRLN